MVETRRKGESGTEKAPRKKGENEKSMANVPNGKRWPAPTCRSTS